MNTDLIFSNINNHISLSKEEKVYFSNFLKEESLKKNDFLLKEAAPCNYIYFVNSGALRAFYINPNGKESTIMFAIKDWWITDMYAFTNEQVAMVNIEVIKNCSLLKISKRDLDKVFDNIPAFNRYFRILIQNAYSREQLRTIQNLSLTAKERYNYFLEKYPSILQKITQKQLASYLGITPEFLSTIRKSK